MILSLILTMALSEVFLRCGPRLIWFPDDGGIDRRDAFSSSPSMLFWRKPTIADVGISLLLVVVFSEELGGDGGRGGCRRGWW